MNISKQLPELCPSCSTTLTVTRLVCESCSTAVEGQFPLPAIVQLNTEEQQLAIQFILAGGNLKELAKQYGISYPTIRNRLDTLILHLKNITISE